MKNPNGPSIEQVDDWNDALADQEAERLLGAARGSVPTVKLASGHEVPEYILCEKCGQKLHISPNTKGAFSYQGCNCHEPDWMQ